MNMWLYKWLHISSVVSKILEDLRITNSFFAFAASGNSWNSRPPAAAPGVGRLACRIRRPRPSATALWERAVFAAVARYRWVSRQAAVAGRQASERARCSRVWPEVEQHVPPCVTLTTVGKPRPGPRVAHCRILQRHSLPDSCRWWCLLIADRPEVGESRSPRLAPRPGPRRRVRAALAASVSRSLYLFFECAAAGERGARARIYDAFFPTDRCGSKACAVHRRPCILTTTRKVNADFETPLLCTRTVLGERPVARSPHRDHYQIYNTKSVARDVTQ